MATDCCWRMKNRAEPPPTFLATRNMANTPSSSTRVIHTLKYSIMEKTTSTMAPDWIREGMLWLTSWRRVSMSLV